MTMALSTRVRNALLDAIESSMSTAPFLEFRTGAPPTNPSDPSTGNLLSRDALPSDWMSAAAAGAKAKNGTWTATGLAGITTSNIGYFRIYGFGSPDMCDIQGTVTATGGGGDMTVDNISLAAAQVVTINTFTLTAPNATS